jgi:hypothetical protein
MDMKRILLIALIGAAVVASASAVSAGWFDGLLGQEPQDNTVEIDSITFNTTNMTGFELYNQTEDEDGNYRLYVDENKTGYNVHIYNYSYADDITWNNIVQSYKEFQIGNSSSQTVDGVTVYTVAANAKNNVGQPKYVSYVENDDLQIIVDFLSPDPAETAKMASTMKIE